MKNIAAFLRKFHEEVYDGNSPWPARGLLCLGVIVAYSNVWPNGFVFDDVPLITRNGLLKQWSDLPELLTTVKHDNGLIAGFCRPLQALVYFLIYQAFGPCAIAFHALNIALHGANTCLLHHFAIKSRFKKSVAFAVALLWGLHPLHTTDVAYIASTAELLWSFFCLLGLITLLPDFTSRRIWRSMTFFALALCSKESAAVFPALAAVTFFFVNEDRQSASAYLKMWPLWLLSAGYIAVWFWFIHVSGSNMDRSPDPQWVQLYTGNLKNRLLTSLSTLTVYARLIIWPAGLHIERVYPTYLTLLLWQPMTGAVIAGLCLLQIIWGKMRRGLALSFGILWFAVALSPYTGIVLPIDAIISEGWMYMPTVGLSLGVVQTVSGIFERKKNAAQLLVAAFALSLGLTAFFQNYVWRTPETLYQDIIKNGGSIDRLSPSLAMFYMEQGEFDKAISQFQYTISHPPNQSRILWAETHVQLAMAWLHIPPDKGGETFTLDPHALSSSPHLPEAIAELGRALQENPEFYWAHAVLALIYRSQGNREMADFHDGKVKAILREQGGARQ